jgi:hypothetical protein
VSTLRKAYRITVDGEPHDIVTSARDFAMVEQPEDGTPANPGLQTWALLHAACMRLEVSGVPHDLDKFIDLLDDVTDLDGIPNGVPELENPTHAGG